MNKVYPDTRTSCAPFSKSLIRMIQDNEQGQSNQPLKYKVRRAGPLDAYIYIKGTNDTDMQQRQENMFIHLPEALEQKIEFKLLHIFTDGACTNNGRVNANAAWGVLLVSDIGHVVLDRYSGAIPKSEPQTNQRAELTALLRALTIADKQLHLDSSLKTAMMILFAFF